MLRRMTMPGAGIPLPQVLQQDLYTVKWQALCDGLSCFTVAVASAIFHGRHDGCHQLARVSQIQGHPCSFAERLILLSHRFGHSE